MSSLRPVACSGAMYCGVPISAASWVSTVFAPRILEMPKSRILTTSRVSPPSSVGQRKMLSGLRSRWTTPSRCAAASAEPTWLTIASVCSKVGRPR